MARGLHEVVATAGGRGRRATLSDNLRIGETPLSLSLYDSSISLFARMLGNLSHFLEKAEAHAKETGADLQTYMDASLGHGMFNFTRQIQLASDAAKSGAAR